MMLSLFEKNFIAAKVTPPDVPKPTAMSPRVTVDAIAEYRTTAERVGVMNGALKNELVLHELAAMGLRVFAYDDVERYLDHLFGKAKDWSNRTWGWRPLRTKDGEGITRNASVTARNPNNGFLPNTYQQAVPLPVLLTVERLEQVVPDLHFFVSDKVTPDDSDPFLAVTSVGMSMLVIERWDEPNFKG